MEHPSCSLNCKEQGKGEEADMTGRQRKRERQQLLQERIHLVRLLTAAITRATVRKLAGGSTAVVKAFLHAEHGKAQECH